MDEVKAHQTHVVAISSLLTTTMLGMQHVVDALREAGLRDRVKILIGGAPVDEAFANEIGADGFATNAAAGANLARRLVSEPASY